MTNTETSTQTKWAIDPMHSEVLFKVKHLVISTVTGSFKKFAGEVTSNNEDFSGAAISFSIETASVDTNQEMRDSHLKSADFFDTANHPTITFQSTSFTKANGNNYSLKGNLTIKGITKEIEVQAEYGGAAKDSYGNQKAGFEITGTINRKDFGLTYNVATEAGGLTLGEDIKLIANIQISKAI
jgi:polyisoprenoid-binding protein YceI